MENNSKLLEFSRFLHEEMAIKPEDLSLALHKRQSSSDPLPMLLWQYGFISLHQLQSILDWLDNSVISEQLSKKSGLKPRLLKRKVLGAGHKSPLQKRPAAPCLRYQ